MFSNKALWKLMAPLAFDQLLNSMMGTVGTMVVSNLGSAAISAVSLVDAINVLIVQAFLCTGGRRNSCMFPISWMQKRKRSK